MLAEVTTCTSDNDKEDKENKDHIEIPVEAATTHSFPLLSTQLPKVG